MSCPTCGAESTRSCLFPSVNDVSVKRPKVRIHKARVNKAKEYRYEHRI